MFLFKKIKYLLIFATAILLIIAASTLKLPDKKLSQKQSIPVNENSEDIRIMATNLDVPWSLDFLPDKSLLFTQRSGSLYLIDANGSLKPNLVATIPQVRSIGEGGLLGVAVHPKYLENKYVFLYYTYAEKLGTTLNRVVRYEFSDKKLANEKIIIDKMPGAINHNGGRIKFGPDGFLYVTTGDALNPSLAQDKNSLAGKILRVNEEGEAASGNIFGNLVYSYGHRNPQGLAWDSVGQLWETEHGPSAHDEINLVEAGLNYGWPTVTGSKEISGMKRSVLESGNDTWAPSGAVFWKDSLFFAGLRGNTLFETKLINGKLELKKHFEGKFGRIRDVVLGPDEFLYILTSNRDGRGNPVSEDDRIIKINPAIAF